MNLTLWVCGNRYKYQVILRNNIVFFPKDLVFVCQNFITILLQDNKQTKYCSFSKPAERSDGTTLKKWLTNRTDLTYL